MRKRTAIDVGASAVRVVAPGREEITVFPSVVALDCTRGDAVEFGEAALQQAKRLPGSVMPYYPLYSPEYWNAQMLEGLFSHAASYVKSSGKFASDLVLSVGVDMEESKETMFPEAASVAGAKDVYFINPLHAVSHVVDHAIGSATLIVHIGASAARIGIFQNGEMAAEQTMSVAGRCFDDAVGDDIYDRYGLLLDDEGAEKVKLTISSPDLNEETIKTQGIHHLTGLPVTMDLDVRALREVLVSSYAPLIDALKAMIENHEGQVGLLVLSGGSANAYGLPDAMREILPEGAVLQIAEHPEETVIRGICAIIAENEIE